MNKRTQGLSLLAGIAGVAFSLSGAPATADDAPGRPMTYAEHVAPILNNNCVSCHRPGQIGPMSLTSYQEARPWARAIRQTVSERTMPPWHADPAHGHFRNDRRLSDVDVAAIAAWVDQGAPSGDLSKAPELPIDTSVEWAIGEPDQIFEMPEYHVADDVEDLYMHFMVPANFADDRDIVAMEIKAGAEDMVHHVLIFSLPASMGEASVFDDPGTALRSDFITGWAPGTDPLLYKDGYAKRLKAGNNLLFQVHYHKTPGPGTGGIDKSRFAVKYAPEPVENPTMTAWIMDLELKIPPGESEYTSVSQFEFKTDGRILGYTPHMHLRGKTYTFEALYPDGTVETLLHVPQYDFNWQTFYSYAEEKFIPKGTVIKATAVFDNSADNPNNPDPSQTVYFSEKTTDEMHIGFMEYAYDDKRTIAQKYGFPEGFNMYEFQQRERARYQERVQRQKQAVEDFKSGQAEEAPSFVPADAAGPAVGSGS